MTYQQYFISVFVKLWVVSWQLIILHEQFLFCLCRCPQEEKRAGCESRTAVPGALCDNILTSRQQLIVECDMGGEGRGGWQKNHDSLHNFNFSEFILLSNQHSASLLWLWCLGLIFFASSLYFLCLFKSSAPLRQKKKKKKKGGGKSFCKRYQYIVFKYCCLLTFPFQGNTLQRVF